MASLFDAMNTAVSGLSAQGIAMSNISNNIANAQTVGFKGTNTSFADLVSAGSLTTDATGVGSRSISTSDVSGQGTLTTATSGTDLAISGNGFFAVQTGQVNANGTVSFPGPIQYTRRGDFSTSAQGYLVNSVGAYLEGYAIDQKTGFPDNSTLVPIQISNSVNAPVATSSMTLDANLPANATTGVALPPTTLQVYDAVGNAHDVQLNWTPNGSGAWTAEVVIPDATGGGFDNKLNATFGAGGAGVNAGTLQTLADGGGGAFTTTTAPGAAQATFSVDFGSGPQSITLNLGTYNQTGGLTQFSSPTKEVTVSSSSQNGLPQGTFQSLSIDGTGNVSANYSNGQTVTLYQLPLAQFQNPDGLSPVSGSLFIPTATSGTAILGTAGQGIAGTIQSSELENSNVDLTSEFTKMIQTQQVYSANSRSITTANNMLNDLLSIIHP
ncbi:MAG TPA: flagellar hook protein FlgE [Stellaceae bacterium]|nr:flagellar hook protein FlgE [Stellaceae bacterium]